MGNVQSRMCLFTLVMGIGLTFGQGNSELVKRAVESNDPLDQFLAGSWYMMSGLGKEVAGAKGINRDYLEARRWFEKAAEGGNAEAQYDLGVMYQLGKGMPIQLEKAAHSPCIRRLLSSAGLMTPENQKIDTVILRAALLRSNSSSLSLDISTHSQLSTWIKRYSSRGKTDDFQFRGPVHSLQ